MSDQEQSPLFVRHLAEVKREPMELSSDQKQKMELKFLFTPKFSGSIIFENKSTNEQTGENPNAGGVDFNGEIAREEYIRHVQRNGAGE